MEIKVYTTPTCPWCQKLKEWLKKKRIRFTELDTTEESQYRDELIEKTNQMGVPVIEIDGNIVVGFDEEKIAKLIEEAKERKKAKKKEEKTEESEE